MVLYLIMDEDDWLSLNFHVPDLFSHSKIGSTFKNVENILICSKRGLLFCFLFLSFPSPYVLTLTLSHLRADNKGREAMATQRDPFCDVMQSIWTTWVILQP